MLLPHTHASSLFHRHPPPLKHCLTNVYARAHNCTFPYTTTSFLPFPDGSFLATRPQRAFGVCLRVLVNHYHDTVFFLTMELGLVDHSHLQLSVISAQIGYINCIALFKLYNYAAPPPPTPSI